jgi:HlyD family secretion protein
LRLRNSTFTAIAVLTGLTLAPAADTSERQAVASLGRLEPGDGVIDVSSASGERLRALEVTEGQLVKADDILAVMESHDERRAVRDAHRVLVEEMRLLVRRNRELTPLDIESQEAGLRRLESEVTMARADLQRLASLRTEELVGEQEYDHQEAVTRQVEANLAEAAALLKKIRYEQAIELLESEARLRRAEADLASAEARLAQTIVRAPIDGQVLKIFTWPGERVENDPILRMGATHQMYAVAEVYETDVADVRVGQTATVSSPALGVELSGTVERIGWMIHKNDVLDVDPAAETDARIVEVRIRLKDSAVAARYVHLQVDVEIALKTGGSSP